MTDRLDLEEPRVPRPARAPSDRSFGLTMAAVLLVYAVYAYVHGRRGIIVAIVALMLGAIAAVRPQALHAANLLWTRLGRAMERVVNPIVLGVLWAVVITPIALLMRLTRRDPLQRRIDRAATSYWVQRDAPPPADFWSRQF